VLVGVPGRGFLPGSRPTGHLVLGLLSGPVRHRGIEPRVPTFSGGAAQELEELQLVVRLLGWLLIEEIGPLAGLHSDG